MWESFFGFKKTPFSDSPDAKQLFASQAWNQVKTRLEFLAQHHGVGLVTGEVGAGKSTAARVFTTTLNTKYEALDNGRGAYQRELFSFQLRGFPHQEMRALLAQLLGL